MVEPRIHPTKQSVASFLKTIEPEKKREDAATLVALFKKVTGEKPVVWTGSIIGFGKFRYKATQSEGEWMRVSFSPRKANLSIHVLEWQGKPSPHLKKLGKYKAGGGCLYVNKLADIDLKVLALMIKEAYKRKHRNEVTK